MRYEPVVANRDSQTMNEITDKKDCAECIHVHIRFLGSARLAATKQEPCGIVKSRGSSDESSERAKYAH